MNDNLKLRTDYWRIFTKCIKKELNDTRTRSFDYRRQLEEIPKKLTCTGIFIVLIAIMGAVWVSINQYQGGWHFCVIVSIIASIYLMRIMTGLICQHAYDTGDNMTIAWYYLIKHLVYQLHIVIVTYFGTIFLVISLCNKVEQGLSFLIDVSQGVIWLNKLLAPLINPGPSFFLSTCLVTSIVVIVIFSLLSRKLIIENYFRIFVFNELYRKVDIIKHMKVNWSQVIMMIFIVFLLLSYKLNIDKMVTHGSIILDFLFIIFLLHYADIVIIDYKIEKDYRLNFNNLNQKQ